MITLRQHQNESVSESEAAWQAGIKNVLLVLPTGAGKTVIMADKAKRCQERNEGFVIFAHRDVLLEQISAALCRAGVYHNLYCSKPTRTFITTNNHIAFGNSFFSETSFVIVASVDTFWRRDIAHLLPYIKYWAIDEGHHLTRGSKWHRCIEKLDELQHMKGLIVTATPLRADRKGLGRQSSGVADKLIVGADMATLIRRELLCRYKIYIPDSTIDVSDVQVTASGDYNRDQLAKKTDQVKITGDVIVQWKRHALNQQTIIFTVNIEHSNHVAAQFRAAGINAVSLSSEDPAAVRKREIDNFRAGRTKILVNCDLFSEGFDVPAVVCVVMLRKTLSYAMFKQQFGRMLRILNGKDYGILLDHVGNVQHFMNYYGLKYPHDDPIWGLDDAPKKPSSRKSAKDEDAIKCPECLLYYIPETDHEKRYCPDCNHDHDAPRPIDATKSVDAAEKFKAGKGGLKELIIPDDAFKECLAKRAKHDEDPEAVRNRMKFAGAPPMVYNSAASNHAKRRNAQFVLRAKIQEWCSLYAKNTGANVDEVQAMFAKNFGMHIVEAQILGEPETIQLTQTLTNFLQVPRP